MTPTIALDPLRPAGVALLITVALFMVGAWAAAYFRQWPLPATSQEKLTLIADDRIGWTAQAIIFPVCFLAVAIDLWLDRAAVARRLAAVWAGRGRHRRQRGGAAALATHHGESAVSGAQAAALLAGHDPNAPLLVPSTRTPSWRTPLLRWRASG